MDYQIKKFSGDNYDFLKEFLYEAIFVPEGEQKPPKSIINKPELQVYLEDFGKIDDFCFVAYSNCEIIGAAWSRIMDDYGHIDEETPSLAISVKENFRNKGTGTQLIKTLLERLEKTGYESVSLSVQKANYAANMYRKLGFEEVSENDEEWIMRKKLK